MIETYRQVLGLFTASERSRFGLLLCVALVNGAMQASGLLALLAFLRIVASPELITQMETLNTIYVYLGFATEQSFILFIGFSAFCIVLISTAFQSLTFYAVTRFSMMRAYSLSWRLLQSYVMQPYSRILQRNSADIGQAILSEVEVVLRQTLIPASELMMVATSILFISVTLFLIEPYVALGALSVIGIAYGLVFWIARSRLNNLGKARVEANNDRFKVAQEVTGGVKEIKISGLEQVMIGRFRLPAFRMAQVQARSLSFLMLPKYALEAVIFGGLILFILGVLLRGGAAVEDLVPTLGLLGVAGIKLFPSMQQLYRLVSELKNSQHIREKMLATLAEMRDVPEAPPAKDDTRLPFTQTLNLNDVTYRYPETSKSALNGLSLQIARHQFVGFVGGTGAGKTTVIDVLLGLLPPLSGALCVDGVAITEANRRDWQRNIGYVPQQIFLTDDTVAANIAFGIAPEDIDMDRIETVARMASLHDFIVAEMAQGYHTEVGERGIRLSGGQRQRIGIARALYHDPEVLILDEATSALDNITEEAVMDAVQNLSGQKTIIVIAHRLTTVEQCDRIFLLENGRIAADGTYTELLEASQTFRRMARVE